MSKLLVVDDEQNIRNIIKKYGEFEGHIIEEAVDGMEAIEKCKRTTYDLIIMDIMMPNLDGFSAVKEIRKDCQSPVIISPQGERNMIVSMALRLVLMTMSLNHFHQKN